MKKEEIHQTHTLGKVMSLMAWLLFMALSTLFMDKWIKSKYQHLPVHQNISEYEGTQYTVIERNIGSHYMARGTINGHKVLFLIDTGATEVVIPGELADTLKLSPGKELSARTAGGTISIFQTELDNLTIGHIKLNNVSANINPKMDGHEILLGMNVLKKINFKQQNGTLYLSERKK